LDYLVAYLLPQQVAGRTTTAQVQGRSRCWSGVAATACGLKPSTRTCMCALLPKRECDEGQYRDDVNRNCERAQGDG